jgi:hypothetical protein
MAFKIKLSSGSLDGIVVPVNLDVVAYGPDRADPGADLPTDVSLHMLFDEDVLSVIESTISAGGVHEEGTDSISWTDQSIKSLFTQFVASFQWLDFEVKSTTVNATLIDSAGNSVQADRLVLGRPPAPSGLARK